CLMDLDWSLKDQELLLKVRKDYNRKVGRYYIKEECFPSYKQLFWDEGIIHHEDVLYFSFNLLEQYPMIKEFLSAKYPYIFLDEFQDTNPIQTQIIKWLGEAGSVTGVIGDPAQSIYKFQGASRKDFLEFNLLNQKNYKIEKNRRSTENIIKILNHLRNGDNINQSCYR
ncbi:ATP-dependent helicase, partial [Clostridium botulinum]|uniref:UvrD-helicase domain-containing protein n=1 Tax=Clostridium botulinum TaxID=1491 RepID=UPI001C9ADFB5